MKDSDKTKFQLIQELSELRQHISALEKSQTIREQSGLDLKCFGSSMRLTSPIVAPLFSSNSTFRSMWWSIRLGIMGR